MSTLSKLGIKTAKVKKANGFMSFGGHDPYGTANAQQYQMQPPAYPAMPGNTLPPQLEASTPEATAPPENPVDTSPWDYLNTAYGWTPTGAAANAAMDIWQAPTDRNILESLAKQKIDPNKDSILGGAGKMLNTAAWSVANPVSALRGAGMLMDQRTGRSDYKNLASGAGGLGKSLYGAGKTVYDGLYGKPMNQAFGATPAPKPATPAAPPRSNFFKNTVAKAPVGGAPTPIIGKPISKGIPKPPAAPKSQLQMGAGMSSQV